MENLPPYSAHANGSSLTSTIVSTTGRTTEERLAGEDHAEIRYFTRYAVSRFCFLCLADGAHSYDHHGESVITELLEAGY